MAPTTSTARQKNAKQQTPLRKLIKEHNIHFYPIGDGLPASLEREKAAVEAIANATYQANLERSSQVTQERVEDIWEAVRWCLKNENNEDKWRHEVETNILNRLTKHHACPQCGKRLWRADFEFPIGDEQGDRWENLRRRRARRDKCACKSRIAGDGKPKDRVFESLPGSKVRYGPDIRDRIPTGIRPDRVVGLFNGPKSTRLLDAPSKADSAKRVGDLVKSDIFVQEDPYVQDDSAMIFPFLVLEAKRARAPDSLEDIERQMAFPTYEMLRAQNRLLENAVVSQASDRLPRVWLVSFKAQIWRLYVATMEQDEDEEYNYDIYNVWSGDVSGKSDALKLVLLLDCVFDWALDIYRLDIFESLQSMVAPNPRITTYNMAPTVSDLSEALGGLGVSDPMGFRAGDLDTIQEDTQEDVLKYKNGWIRCGRQVMILGEGLLITATNIADIFENFEHPDHARRFARLVWALLSREAWLFPSETILDRVREVWTGKKEHRQEAPKLPIYVQLEVYAYIDINWQPTRKLIFVAATEDSLPELFKHTHYEKRRSAEIEMTRRQIPEKKFLAELRERRKPRDLDCNLKDAVRRWHRWLGSGPGRKLEWTRVSVPSCDKAFQEMFRMYQVGRKQPSESFFKIWHSSQPTLLVTTPSDEEYLVVGDTDERDWHHMDPRNRAPRLCIFVPGALDELVTSKLAKFFDLSRKEGFKEVFYHYTVLRGKYFSGSTHFDDNSPVLGCWWLEGPMSPSNARRPIFPNLALLLGSLLWELKNGEPDHSDTGSEDEGYRTDDSDHRRDCRKSWSEEEVDSGEDEETNTESDEYNEEEEEEDETSDEDDEEEDESSEED